MMGREVRWGGEYDGKGGEGAVLLKSHALQWIMYCCQPVQHLIIS